MNLRRSAGEFAVIVLGVLVALFAESAWDDWQEANLVDGYLERMAAEVASNRSHVEYDLRFFGLVCQIAEWVGDALTDRIYEVCNFHSITGDYVRAQIDSLGVTLDLALGR